MKFDIAIVGGGPGGYTAAIFAAKNQQRVALIEKHKIGGTCLNYGCIPTKALIHTAEVYKSAQNALAFGVEIENVSVNWKLAQRNKSEIVGSLTSSVDNLLIKNGVTVFQGEASFLNDTTLKVKGLDGEKTVEADNIIIAAGSIPIIIPIPGHELENVITSKEALELETIPESMAVIGGGVIGLEIGHIYQTLGSKITVIEMLSQILPREDADVSEVMSDTLKDNGMEILTGCQVSSIEKLDDKLKLTYREQDMEHTIVVDKVLMAVGRKADLTWLGQFPIQIDQTGIVVDQYLRTSNPHIFAIGDVTGKNMLAHIASHQGIVAVRNVMGQQVPMSYRAAPSCLYTTPEAASVGITEAEAKKKFGDAVNVSYFEFQMNGKAITMGETAGFVKIITGDQWKEILGVHIVGPKATELIAEAVLAIRLECTAEELMDTIHAHPTLSEAVMEACAGIFGEAIHTLG